MNTTTTIADFCLTMATLCRIHSASVTSWMRTPTRNKAVGGTEPSFHQHGLAMDVVLDDPTGNRAFVEHAQAVGLQAIDERTHIHVEADNRVTRLTT